VERSGLEIIPANVPGNFELDLQRAGLLPDPFFGMNMRKVNDLEDRHVYYFRRFSAAPEEETRPVLVFEGLDTYADVFLNGELIASCDNMLITQEIPLGGKLKAGENELFVHIRPAVLEALKYEYPPCMAAHIVGYEALYARRAQHSYGWDIMPRAISAGIWRPVSVEMRPKVRLESAYLATQSLTEDHSEAELRFCASSSAEPLPFGRYEVEVSGVCGGSGFSARAFSHCPKAIRVRGIRVKNPMLWWPRGYGMPSLYDVTVSLLCDGRVVDTMKFRHGIRLVELQRTSTTDESGSGEFVFRVNHERVFMRGSNWVPLDAFHSRDTERLERAFALAVELDCNILRCWGGNVYESDRFFDLCDEHGVCVWQDFAMGCAIYPQDKEFKGRLEREARSVVRRLRRHPSLILWAGDNECDSAFHWHGLGDPNRNSITRELLPGIVWEEDPARQFLPSSPFIDDEVWKRGERYIPEQHLWGPRDSFKSDFYRMSTAHFASEIGYHGCPSPASIGKFISKDKLWPWRGNDEWRLHASCPSPDFLGDDQDSRNALMAKQVKELFGAVPNDLETFSFASQCVQAEAKKFFIEMFRSAMWRRTGIIWWNLLDGWPQFSDAIVDYYFGKKRAYDYIKRAQRHICLMFREPSNFRLQLAASNASLEPSNIKFSVRDAETGETLISGEKRAEANRVTELGYISFSAGEKKMRVIEWEDRLGQGRSHYLAGQPPFDLEWYKAMIKKTGL
jgi:beta-mannosidase